MIREWFVTALVTKRITSMVRLHYLLFQEICYLLTVTRGYLGTSRLTYRVPSRGTRRVYEPFTAFRSLAFDLGVRIIGLG